MDTETDQWAKHFNITSCGSYVPILGTVLLLLWIKGILYLIADAAYVVIFRNCLVGQIFFPSIHSFIQSIHLIPFDRSNLVWMWITDLCVRFICQRKSSGKHLADGHAANFVVMCWKKPEIIQQTLNTQQLKRINGRSCIQGINLVSDANEQHTYLMMER